jgi:transposase-like protein
VSWWSRAQSDGVCLVGPGVFLADLTKRVLEAGLNAELTENVGYEAPRPGRPPLGPQPQRDPDLGDC